VAGFNLLNFDHQKSQQRAARDYKTMEGDSVLIVRDMPRSKSKSLWHCLVAHQSTSTARKSQSMWIKMDCSATKQVLMYGFIPGSRIAAKQEEKGQY